jgi:uncharacterized protein YdcH (DUF465 family)
MRRARELHLKGKNHTFHPGTVRGVGQRSAPFQNGGIDLMPFEAVLEAQTPPLSVSPDQPSTRARLGHVQIWKMADRATSMPETPPPKQLDAETVRRLHSEDPFFRARADRYAVLDDLVRAQEATAEATTTARKYIEALKKRRDLILLELVDLIADKSSTKLETLWKVPAPLREATPSINTPNTRTWHWP